MALLFCLFFANIFYSLSFGNAILIRGVSFSKTEAHFLLPLVPKPCLQIPIAYMPLYPSTFQGILYRMFFLPL